MIDTKKNYKIEFIRCFAILSVMLGHSIILYDPSWGIYTSINSSNILIGIKRIINIYQMPIFMMISGFCFTYSVKKNSFNKDWYIKKVKRLLVPYIFFFFFYVVPIRLLCKYPAWTNTSILKISSNIISGYDVGMLWFLPTLFFITILATLSNRIKNKMIKSIYYIFLLMISLKSSIFPSIFYISSIAIYLFWFELGNYLHMNIEKIETNRKNAIILILLLLLCFILLFFVDYKLIIKFLKILIPIIIFLILYLFCGNKQIKIVSKISSNSFGLYLFHSPLLYFLFNYFPNIPISIFIFCGFCILGTISYVLTAIIKRTKLKILIGE